MAFSEKFLKGLMAKSREFQDQFFKIMDILYDYLENDDEKIREFQQFIEDEISYYGKGNQLWWQESQICGAMTPQRREEYLNELYEKLDELFAGERELGAEYGMYTATNIIIAAKFPAGTITEDVLQALNFLIYQNRPDNPPELTVISSDKAENASFCIVTMK